MENSRFKIIALSLGVLVLLLGGLVLKSQYLDRPTLITVVGEGRVKTAPEMVNFTVSIINSANTPALAVADNGRMVKDVISVIKGAGVESEDIVVSYVRVVPSSVGLGQTSYQAVNAIDVTLKNISKFDNLVNSLYSAGAQSISNIVFTTQDSKALEKEAVNKAIEDAKARAREIAKVSRKRVGRMISIQTVEAGGAGALSGEIAKESGFGGQISASPSQIEIVRQASIVFELR